MEELKKELEKLSKAYVDIPENEEKILIPFVKRLLELSLIHISEPTRRS